MKLRELLADAEVAEIAGDAEVEIAGLAYDSRSGRAGHALLLRSRAALGRPRVRPTAPSSAAPRRSSSSGSWTSRVTQVRVADARAAMAPIAVRFWGDPTAQLRVAGVTGTNGKTTTAFLIRHVLEAHGTRTGLLGTVKRVVGGVEEEVERTTPEAIDLQRTFRRMLDGGDAACAMEVSSHALALERTAGVRFAVAVFTNLTQDHLDFHADMEEYFLAKRGLFSSTADGSPREPRPRWSTWTIPTAHGWRPSCEDAGEPPLLTFSPSGAEGADFRAAGRLLRRLRVAVSLPRSRRGGRGADAAARPLQRRERAGGDRRLPRARRAGRGGRRRPGERRPGPGALRAGRRGAAVRGPGRLRPHPRLAGERARGGAQS